MRQTLVFVIKYDVIGIAHVSIKFHKVACTPLERTLMGCSNPWHEGGGGYHHECLLEFTYVDLPYTRLPSLAAANASAIETMATMQVMILVSFTTRCEGTPLPSAFSMMSTYNEVACVVMMSHRNVQPARQHK